VNEKQNSKIRLGARSHRALLVIAVGLLLWFLPNAQLKPEARHLLAIFVATITGLIARPLPQGAVVLAAIALTAISGTLPLQDVLEGFGDPAVWLIVTAFLLSRGLIKTGLGKRIAFMMVQAFGGSTLGLGYALTLTDAVIAPATPSNTGRGGGILFPIVRSLSSCLGSEPGPTAAKAGAFLMFNSFQTNLVTSAMFMTACAPNLLMVRLAKEHFGYTVTWTGWLAAAVIPAAISLALLPFLIYRHFKPEIRRPRAAGALARQELEQMGPLSRGEKRMLVVFLGAILLWSTSQWTNLNAAAVALAGVAALLIWRVIEWADVLSEKGAWDALIWFGGLVSLASGLAKVGVIDLLAAGLKSGLVDLDSRVLGFVLVVIAYLYSHYLIASMTAHAAALYVPLGLVAISLGAAPGLVALVLAFVNNLNAAMTTYGTGPSPIYFGAGYVDQGTWWKMGFALSVVHLIVWLGIGGVWWKLIGLW